MPVLSICFKTILKGDYISLHSSLQSTIKEAASWASALTHFNTLSRTHYYLQDTVQLNHTQEISFPRWHVCFSLVHLQSFILLYLSHTHTHTHAHTHTHNCKKEKNVKKKEEKLSLPRFQLPEFGKWLSPLNGPRILRTTYVKMQI